MRKQPDDTPLKSRALLPYLRFLESHLGLLKRNRGVLHRTSRCVSRCFSITLVEGTGLEPVREDRCCAKAELPKMPGKNELIQDRTNTAKPLGPPIPCGKRGLPVLDEGAEEAVLVGMAVFEIGRASCRERV